MPSNGETKRQRYNKMVSQLELERSSFLSHWRELSENINPRRARFTVQDVNKGDRRNQKIIDTTPIVAARTLRAGMMGGVTSPARPWFRLSVPDQKLADVQAVKEWLFEVGVRMSNVFLKSNLYQVLPLVYGDIGTFATSAMMVEEDIDEVVRFYVFPIGTYCVSANQRGKIDVFTRDLRLTVRQIVAQFCKKNGKDIDFSTVSDHVRQAYQDGNFEEWIDVRHIIMPNPEFDERKLQSKFKRFVSCYYETGGSSAKNGSHLKVDDDNKYLRESGYDQFPVLCPRWECASEDAYGTSCPGMDALGDIKALQLMQKRMAQAVEKMVNPPMTGPSSLRTSKVSILPGDVTIVDDQGQGGGFRPAHLVDPKVRELEQMIESIQRRINQAFYADLFLMLANDNRSGITATEIDERKEEKLLALGPVLEQLNQDLLDPLIDMTFDYMMKRSVDAAGNWFEDGLLPKPPDELQNIDLKIEYISVMAVAQKLVGLGAVERFTSYVGSLAGFDPSVVMKLNTDEMIESYADITSVPPKLIRSKEQVDAIRQQQAQAQAAQAQADLFKQGAGAAKDLSQTDIEGDNALSAMLQQANAGSLT